MFDISNDSNFIELKPVLWASPEVLRNISTIYPPDLHLDDPMLPLRWKKVAKHS